jgi:hypothetical protein
MISSTSQGVGYAPFQATAGSNAPEMDKIVIAIHGIGSQRRSDTIRAVAKRFGSRSKPALPVMPLGFFQLGKTGEVHLSRLETSFDDPLARIGFAEVFWADIPREVVKTGDTLEETKAWAASVVSRARATYFPKVKHPQQLKEEDFNLGTSVIEELIETVRVLENLLFVAEKAGVFKFDLAPLLRDYIGDVQLVTEFKFYRDKIIYRFHSALTQILELFEKTSSRTPEIYVVAHSEGTVISFLGLLQALSQPTVVDPDDPNCKPITTDWIRYVRGFMTIGSPIGRHIMLWPKLWEGLKLACHLDGDTVVFAESGVERLTLQGRIKWRNYYDVGDPIGSKLDAVSDFLQREECSAFEFSPDHDYGFSRYWLPGKAHTDYWDDPHVFGHFIDDVVFPSKKRAPRPPSSALVNAISTFIPYFLTFVLHVAAVFVLYEGIVVATTAAALGGTAVKAMVGIGILGWLLLSVTIGARLPHLVKTTRKKWRLVAGARWLLPAFVPYILGAVFVFSWLPEGVTDYLCAPGGGLAVLCNVTTVPWKVPLVLVLAAFVAAASGWVVPRLPHLGRRTLIGFASFVAVLLILKQLLDDNPQTTAWPVALGGLAFIYIWWLGIMLFDLTFVWHRYVRQSVAIETLIHWLRRGEDARPRRLAAKDRLKKASRP